MHTSPDTTSFAAIVPRHAATMLRVAAALVGPAEAEDAVQEASIRAWQAWASLRSLDAVRSWLLKITLNVCRDWRRGLKGQPARWQPLPEDTDTQHRYPLALLDADPGDSAHTGALDLRAAVNALPTDLRLVVVLRFYAGLDATEIGGLLSIPAGTVRSRLHRSMGQMRELLQPAAADLAPATPPPDRTPRSDMEDRS